MYNIKKSGNNEKIHNSSLDKNNVSFRHQNPSEKYLSSTLPTGISVPAVRNNDRIETCFELNNITQKT